MSTCRKCQAAPYKDGPCAASDCPQDIPVTADPPVYNMRFISVTEELPPACSEVLVIKPTVEYGRRRMSARMEYIGTDPREDVADAGITHWCSIRYPESVDRRSYNVGDTLGELQKPETLRLHLGELTADEVRIAQAAVRFALSKTHKS